MLIIHQPPTASWNLAILDAIPRLLLRYTVLHKLHIRTQITHTAFRCEEGQKLDKVVIVKLSVGCCVENKPNWHALKSGDNINHKRRLVVLWLESELRVMDIGSFLVIAFQSVTIRERGNIRKDSRKNSLIVIHSLFGQIDLDDKRGSKAIE